jgi:hypothetical protein
MRRSFKISAQTRPGAWKRCERVRALGDPSPFWLKLRDSHKGETQKTLGNPGNPENYRN